MYARAARRYRQVDVESAPKSEILIRLFDRCIRDIDDAEVAIEASDVGARAAAIDHAIRIVTELAAALDEKVSPELCANLASLYQFVIEQLSTANNRGDSSALATARAIIENIAESFRLAEAQK